MELTAACFGGRLPQVRHQEDCDGEYCKSCLTDVFYHTHGKKCNPAG